MKTLHLFAGAGGGLYCDLILGHAPVCAVELNPYCCAVLRERRDEGWWPDLFVWEGDVCEFEPAHWKGRVDCVHAGFPCTDISVAGRGAGIEGKASGLWSEVERCVRVIRPRYVFLENSAAITARGLGRVLGDLAALGYDAEWTVLGAEDVGAGHERERWWCLAYIDDQREQQQGGVSNLGRGWVEYCTQETPHPESLRSDPRGTERQTRERGFWFDGEAESVADAHGLQLREQPGRRSGARGAEEEAEPGRVHEEVADLDEERWYRRSGLLRKTGRGQSEDETPHPLCDRPQGPLQRIGIPKADREAIETVKRYCGTPMWNPTFTDVCRVLDGMAVRKHEGEELEANANKGKRIEALGNGQVPLQAAIAWIMLGGPIGEKLCQKP